MALILTSESFKEGELLGTDHVLSEAFGFGCAGGNGAQTPTPVVSVATIHGRRDRK